MTTLTISTIVILASALLIGIILLVGIIQSKTERQRETESRYKAKRYKNLVRISNSEVRITRNERELNNIANKVELDDINHTIDIEVLNIRLREVQSSTLTSKGKQLMATNIINDVISKTDNPKGYEYKGKTYKTESLWQNAINRDDNK